jgi:hypothetical protein
MKARRGQLKHKLPDILVAVHPDPECELKRASILQMMMFSCPIYSPIASLSNFLYQFGTCLYNALHARGLYASAKRVVQFWWEGVYVDQIICPYLQVCGFSTSTNSAGIFTATTTSEDVMRHAFAARSFQPSLRDPLQRSYFENDQQAWELQFQWHASSQNTQYHVNGELQMHVMNPFETGKSAAT